LTNRLIESATHRIVTVLRGLRVWFTGTQNPEEGGCRFVRNFGNFSTFRHGATPRRLWWMRTATRISSYTLFVHL